MSRFIQTNIFVLLILAVSISAHSSETSTFAPGFTPTPTSTYPVVFAPTTIPTLFATGTPTQTPAPVTETTYVGFGDSYTVGSGVRYEECFFYLVSQKLNAWFPHVNTVNCGEGGINSADYLKRLDSELSKVKAQHGGPMTRATVLLGINDLFESRGVTLEKGIANSKIYQSNLRKIIEGILKLSPNCAIVLCTVPDPHNDGQGPFLDFVPQGVFEAYRQRVLELGPEKHCRVADLYTVMMGHPEYYFCPISWMHTGALGQYIMAQTIGAQFSSNPPGVK